MATVPLEVLAESVGREFSNPIEARRRTAAGLEERRTRLEKLDHDPQSAVVLMGSWGRAEATAGSDDDFMVLVHGSEGIEVQPSMDAVRGVFDRTPADALHARVDSGYERRGVSNRS
jgi:UTP:GlnB (protein PII) uridylyltransferase